MDDATQPDSQPPRRPPVKMGLRVVARHDAGRHGGRALAREVVEAHRPKHLDAATRLARHPAPPAPPAPPSFGGDAPAFSAAPAAPTAPDGGYASPPDFAAPTAGLGTGPTLARQPAEPPSAGPSESKMAAAGLSPFAAQWLFGDQASATDDLVPMSVAEKMAEPTKEQRLARFLARGGLERSRGARIVEGAGTGPIPSDDVSTPEEPEAPATPKRLSTKP